MKGKHTYESRIKCPGQGRDETDIRDNGRGREHRRDETCRRYNGRVLDENGI